MKSWLKKNIPTIKSLKKKSDYKILKPFLNSSSLWAFDCQSVARGMAAGLAGAVIPGFQILYATILVILFRGNLYVALLATLVTNPFTVIFVVFFICSVGSFITGNGTSSCEVNEFQWSFSSFHALWSHFSDWFLQFGKAFLIGVPVVSVSLAIIGYFGTIIIWKIYVFLKRRLKK